MDIIFLWNSNLCEKGISLSGKYKVSFELERMNVKIEKNKAYVDSFWGEKIEDCYAIVGENGSGKTRLVNDIMYTIQSIKRNSNLGLKYIIIFEELSTGELSIILSNDFRDIHIDAKNVRYKIEMNEAKYLEDYNIAYFHNALNKNDYLKKNRCEYDFSMGNMIKSFSNVTAEMNYNRLDKDKIVNYYDNDAFRIISFLYEFEVEGKTLNIEFPIPKIVKVSIADIYYAEQYIMGEAKKIAVDRDEEGKLSDEIFKFRSGIENIIKVFGENWINYTIRNLILSCFREICIPYTSNPSKDYRYKDFISVCQFMNNEKKIYKRKVYECAYQILGGLKKEFNEYELQINSIEKYVRWLEKNQNIINKIENKKFFQLEIVTGEQSKKFMNELIELYSENNFAFPFYNFSFGLSTGEYCFLSIFSNLYSIAGKYSSRLNVYNPTVNKSHMKNLLLFFDEADLSMHPRWQRMYMTWLTDFCEKVFDDIHIKIIITTHSPILLSDFPGNSVLYLKKDNSGKICCYKDKRNTFASNIHSLFLDSFFLDKSGIMGAFAEKKINQIAEIVFNQKNEYSTSMDRTKKIIEYIGEGVIKTKLEEQLYGDKKETYTVTSEKDKEAVMETLVKLKSQKNNLEEVIKELEEIIYD